ncbi:MAG: MobF family relaxase [Verrucomicrobiae bacterium]|nr:MobF family relaxase [Verrucomicrobiae bacterium]
MLRIITSTSPAAAKKYFRAGLTKEGYYSEGQEMAGQWGGIAAAKLGLHGAVQPKAFHKLCDNLNPVEKGKLTAHTKGNRRVGYDFNFHVPKSVTLAYAWKRDEKILIAFRKAVRETMAEMEREAATRVRVGGRDEDRITGNLIWSEFIHFTARPVNGIPDPHLHAHCYVFNATFDPVENKWKAAQFGGIKRDASYFQAAFLSRMATSLKEMGYGIELTHNSFEIAGVSRELVEKFSRRGKVVKDKAKELGVAPHSGKDGLGAMTRESKIKDVSLTDLEPEWWARLSPENIKALDGLKSVIARSQAADALVDASRGGKRPDQLALDLAMKHIFERQSVVEERDLIAEALKWGYGTATLEGIKQVVKDTALIRVEKDGRKLVTTWAVRAEEGRIVDRCKQGKGKFAALNPTWKIHDTALNIQQRAGVFHILGSRDFVIGVEGKSGVGKSRLLHEVRRGIEWRGQKMVVLTPMAITAHDTMRKDGFEDAQTVAKLLESETFQREARGAVWLVDEAGLLSCRTMDRLLRLAEQQEARVVLVGDTKQHHAVERGQAFSLLQKFGELPVATVDEIQRQTGSYKRAVEQIAARDFAGAFKTLEHMRAFREMPIQEREAALAKDYLALVKEGKSALIVSPTHAEGESVTHAIRETLKQRGEMGEGEKWNILKNLSWTAAERSDARHYTPGLVVKVNKSLKGFEMGKAMEVIAVNGDEVLVRSGETVKELPLSKAEHFGIFEREKIEIAQGDRIRITANGHDVNDHRLYNGSLYTVKKVGRNGLILENGWKISKDFAHLDYGYATTSHAAQGKTVDCVLVAQSGLISAGATDAKQFYVSVSRGRQEVRIYTDDVEALRENVAREREREMAMELVASRDDDDLVR